MVPFSKTVTIRNGQTLTLRPMVRQDEDELLKFFRRMPEEDLLFLMDNVTDPAVVKRWALELDYTRVLPILALSGERVVANATLHRSQSGLFRHVGEIRCLVDPDFRNCGLAGQMVGEIFRLAMELGLELIQARILEEQKQAVRLFSGVGMRQVALLPNYAKDSHGNRHNVIYMVSDTETLWQQYSDVLMEMDDKSMY